MYRTLNGRVGSPRNASGIVSPTSGKPFRAAVAEAKFLGWILLRLIDDALGSLVSRMTGQDAPIGVAPQVADDLLDVVGNFFRRGTEGEHSCGWNSPNVV